MSAPLPRYVSALGHGEICYPAPLQIADVSCWAFSLKADNAAMQALVDDQLNAACRPELEYRVVGSGVLLTFLRAGRATSLAETIGVLEDREAAFWIPLLERRKGDLGLGRLVFWVPYLLIDVDSGLVIGREIWGYRKALGRMKVPGPTDAAAAFVAETTLFDTFSATTPGRFGPLLTVRSDREVEPLESVWSSFGEAGESIGKLFATHHGPLQGVADGVAVVVNLLEMLFDRIVPIVNLKQFRDAEDSSRACYQAMVESPCHLDRLHGAGPLLKSYTLEVTTCASHRIVEDLGLGAVAAGSTVLPVSFGFWVRMDFTTRNGRVLWQAM